MTVLKLNMFTKNEKQQKKQQNNTKQQNNIKTNRAMRKK